MCPSGIVIALEVMLLCFLGVWCFSASQVSHAGVQVPSCAHANDVMYRPNVTQKSLNDD